MKRILFSALLLVAVAGFAEENLLDKARKLSGEKKYDEALELLRESDKANPDDLEVHDLIQKILKRQGKEEEAREEYRKRYQAASSGLNAYLYLRMLESPVEQEKGFREAIEKDPQSVWGHYGLANALLDQDRLEDAVEAASGPAGTVDNPARLHYVAARTYRRMEDFGKAAAEMRTYDSLTKDEESRGLAMAYGKLEVMNEEDSERQFELAKQWLEEYREDLKEEEELSGAITRAELGMILAGHDYSPAMVNGLAATGLRVLAVEEIPEAGEDRDYYFRFKGTLHALQAWAAASMKANSMAQRALKEATKTGPSSEMFYFSARAERILGNPKQALEKALKAAAFPPVYAGAKELSTELWQEVKGSEFGLEEALKKELDRFASYRKEKILAEQVDESFEPFELVDHQGNQLTPTDLSGKVTLINFWAVWCPPCREELPHWNKFYAQHKGDPELSLIAVGDEPWETMDNYMKNQNYDFAVYRNEKYWEQFSVRGIPTLLVIDATGKIRFRNEGFEEGMDYAQTLLWQIEAARSLR